MTEEIQEFDPDEVARIVKEALATNKILPMSFIETGLFERLTSLLSTYMNPTDVVFVISELKEYFFSGFTKMTAQTLHSAVHNCRKCQEITIDPKLPLWNSSDPDLMIIVENPVILNDHLTILAKALKLAGFSSQRCSLTFVSRCPVFKPSQQVLQNCIPYLHTEIACLNPKLILTLGLTPLVSLTGDNSLKLSDVKGSVIWLGPYAVLPDRSLAGIARGKDDPDDIVSTLMPSLKKAYSFLYGGTNEV
jgi:uracil-DNA glycosylase